MNVIETEGVGKRYGADWALRDCNLAIPSAHVTALIGPNGAGKTTFLNLVVGLALPTAGKIRVLGGFTPGSAAALDGIAFVAQNMPMYANVSAADMLHLTRNLNRKFDQHFAEARLKEFGIPLDRRVGKLSGGQQAQLALTLALARRPRLLVLDEPMAMLDPLARHDFMASVMAAVAEGDMTVVLSSHDLAELERVADYLVVIGNGRAQVAGAVEDLLAQHRLLSGPTSEVSECTERLNVVHARKGGTLTHLLVKNDGRARAWPPGWEDHAVSLEELTLSYLREPKASALPAPVLLGGAQVEEATN